MRDLTDLPSGSQGGLGAPGHVTRGPQSRRFTLPLKLTIMTVFVLTTVPVLLANIQINFTSAQNVARAQAVELVERFRSETMREIAAEFHALKSIIANTAELGRKAPDFLSDNGSLSYLFGALQHSETMLNVYVGTEDGSFRQARRLQDPTAPIHGTVPPAASKYAYRLVLPAEGQPVLDRYVFIDSGQTELGEVAAETGYDPRKRPWYNVAVAAESTVITDPEVFWAFGLVGFTVAEAFSVDGALAGVVAADVTLDSFSRYLAQKSVSPNSLSYLLDENGLVLAASDETTAYGSDNDRVALPHVADVENRLVAFAYGQRPFEGEEEVYEFDLAGQSYIVGLSSFEEDLGKPWRLMVLTPLGDFTGEFSKNNRDMLLLGFGAIVLQLAIIYVIASLLSLPLQRLARKVVRIQNLEDSSDLPVVRSRVREVAALSRAIETLDTAVQAFSRFVPIGLVRQLLGSDQKLELGGQSRFLTILFCDVEAFSTLAERVASRDLLLRISSLLGVVTHRVHNDLGTIDKFVGDGVMAFWGAPAPLDDHAWRACVTALSIQRDMERLNADWRDADEPEMRLRVGIHSDVVLVGNVGSNERLSYTVLGDGVNIASRLEGANKPYGTLICISHDTYREAGDRLCVRPIDEVRVKGRRTLVTIYELMGAYGAGEDILPSPEIVALARATRDAFDALVAGDHALALARYRGVLESHPDDSVAAFHVRNIEAANAPASPVLGNVDDSDAEI